MKKLLLAALLVFLPLTSLAHASAQFDPLASTCFDEEVKVKESLIDEDGNVPAVCREVVAQQEDGENPLTGEDGTLTRVTNLIAIITAMVAVIVIVIAGITMTLSSGDSTKVQNSRNAIIYAVVGLVIVALARSIIVLVINRV